jgi:hypothetical protein
MTKVRTDLILRQLSKRHVGQIKGRVKLPDDVFLTNVKNGRSWDSDNLLIMDALAIRRSWKKPCFTGYEIKVDRSDFLRDQKWPGYLKFCHEFYFVCPVSLIQPEELPNEVGLIYYNPEKDCISTKRKALYRPIEIPSDLLMYLVMSRINSDAHPFFSNKREYFEAFVKEKAEKEKIGRYIAREYGSYVTELSEEIRRLKRDLEMVQKKARAYDELSAVLRRHGFNLYQEPKGLAEDLEKTLKKEASPGLVEKIGQLVQMANALQDMLESR